MTIVRNTYSAVISDAIGNEPIVDQFDIEYGAAFYGTMNDDYVTGSMIVSTDNNSYVTGTRGNYFSQTYASTAASSSSVDCSPDAKRSLTMHPMP